MILAFGLNFCFVVSLSDNCNNWLETVKVWTLGNKKYYREELLPSFWTRILSGDKLKFS